MALFGVDVSSYQPSDFDVSGLSFAFVKATESSDYVNPKYRAQLANARAAGLVVGHYHFAHPGNVDAQVQHFLLAADVRPGEIVAYDWEASGVTGTDRDAWIGAVKAQLPCNKVVLYCNRSYWAADTAGHAGDGLWIADPNSPAGRPNISAPWRFQQYSWAGGVDRDVANFASVGELRAWTVPAVAPVVLPRVSLANVVSAARHDSSAGQGIASHPDDVRPVEAALCQEGLLGAPSGSFGAVCVAAYGEWQRRCGYSGAAANGIPGHGSLVALGAKYGFEVIA